MDRGLKMLCLSAFCTKISKNVWRDPGLQKEDILPSSVPWWFRWDALPFGKASLLEKEAGTR